MNSKKVKTKSIPQSREEWVNEPLEKREQLWNILKPQPNFSWVEIVSQQTFTYQFNKTASQAFETLRDYLKYPFLQGYGFRHDLIYSKDEYFCIDPFNLDVPQVVKDREKAFLQINDKVLDVNELRRRNLIRLHFAEDYLTAMRKHRSFKEPQKVALIFHLIFHPNTQAKDLQDLEIQRSIHPDMRYQGRTLENLISSIKKQYVNVKRPYIKPSSISKDGEILYTLESTWNEKGEEIFYISNNQTKNWLDIDFMP